MPASLTTPARVRYLVVAILMAVAASCTSTTEPSSTPIEQTTFADSLHITLADFTRLPSGVYVRDSIAGTGAGVVLGQQVTISYVGFLANGFVFDRSNSQNPTFTFILGEPSVIIGFNEGVQGMKVGARRRIIIPAELGYGNRERTGIPANSVLLFDITLVSAK
jgi:FKBP-type peptidyl-prolyl cis-trans isomerase